jgi:hypothetical protein
VFTAETAGQTLAEWISLAPLGIVVPRQQTVTIPFQVSVPASAAPGGHYAAILVGTKPPARLPGSFEVQTAQFVTALFFVRIAGDVLEAGSIREFRTTSALVSAPDATFELRFENTGNVHLQPQGDITIYNMWGEERGIIPINHETHFGNVLPSSIRKFVFSWKGEATIFDIGRYKAIATLGYGDDTKQFVTSATYFWIIPYQQILVFVGGLGLLIWFFSFAIKLYVRRMLLMAGVEPSDLVLAHKHTKPVSSLTVQNSAVRNTRYQNVTAPVRSGVRELKLRISSKSLSHSIPAALRFIFDYRVFFVAVTVLVAFVIIVVWYVRVVTVPDRVFEVSIENPDTTLTISSEELLYTELLSRLPVPNKSSNPAVARSSLVLINSSNIPGVAAQLRYTLESEGYAVTRLETDFGRSSDKTLIIYNSADQTAALALSHRLGGALLSVSATATTQQFVVYVGADQKVE